MGRPFLIYLASAALVVACGPTEVIVDGGPGSDASTGPSGRILIESESALTLMYGQSSDVLVRYLEGSAPRSGVELGFALSGNANDADLMSLDVVTGADGRAQTTLVAGSVSSAFRLRVSAERAPPAFVDVSVSDAGFGGLSVTASYEGARAEPARRVITVYAEVGCDPMGGFPASAVARQVTLEDDAETEVVFNTLPSGLSYTVVGVVEGSTGAALATACADGVDVAPDAVTPVRLAFIDAALDPAGTYAIELELSADAFAAVAGRGIDAGVAMGGAGADDFLDALEQELRDRGFVADADGLAAERVSGALTTSLEEQLTAASADPSEALRRFFARLLELFTEVRVGGPLQLGFDDTVAATGVWDAQTLEIGAPLAPDGVPPIALDPTATGLDLAPVIGVAWLADSDEMEVASLSLALPLASLVSAAMQAAASDVASSPGADLRDVAGCGVLTSWVAASATLSPVCDAACADAACLSALSVALDAAQTAVTGEAGLDTITLRGRLRMLDDDGDLTADRVGGTLAGTWDGARMLPSVDTVGTVTGTRLWATD